MIFTVEKLALTNERGTLVWPDGPKPAYCCDSDGQDAATALALVVAEDGGVLAGVSAAYADGQAIMVVKKGGRLYALRAMPQSKAGDACRSQPPSPPFTR